MDNIKEYAKEKGYVETLFNRRRYIPEMNSNNFMVRQFGARVAMNTPIQGTAADIMKIANALGLEDDDECDKMATSLLNLAYSGKNDDDLEENYWRYFWLFLW